jgi:DNA-directed RNA polymerase subunit RPC12/RpoP
MAHSQAAGHPAAERRLCHLAPSPITVTAETNRYVCGQCGTLLVIADDDQVHGLVVRCRECGRYNEVET